VKFVIFRLAFFTLAMAVLIVILFHLDRTLSRGKGIYTYFKHKIDTMKY